MPPAHAVSVEGTVVAAAAYRGQQTANRLRIGSCLNVWMGSSPARSEKGARDASKSTELNESGEFVIPSFAKMSVVNKPATEAAAAQSFYLELAAKPASKSVKASPLKA